MYCNKLAIVKLGLYVYNIYIYEQILSKSRWFKYIYLLIWTPTKTWLAL